MNETSIITVKQSAMVILLFMIGFNAYSQRDSVNEVQCKLTGRIKSKVYLTPDCGYIAWGTVVEFEVINLTGMTYPNKNIGIIITCPEFYKKDFLEKGKIYQIVFSNKNQATFSWTIPNEDLLKTNRLSFKPYAVSVIKNP